MPRSAGRPVRRPGDCWPMNSGRESAVSSSAWSATVISRTRTKTSVRLRGGSSAGSIGQPYVPDPPKGVDTRAPAASRCCLAFRHRVGYPGQGTTPGWVFHCSMRSARRVSVRPLTGRWEVPGARRPSVRWTCLLIRKGSSSSSIARRRWMYHAECRRALGIRRTTLPVSAPPRPIAAWSPSVRTREYLYRFSGL
jgi:hypothetical protein